MKLSKAQQAVVDKMREGYSLFLCIGVGWFLVEIGCVMKVGSRTFRSLLQKKVVCEKSKTELVLTEQYKNLNNENSDTGDNLE